MWGIGCSVLAVATISRSIASGVIPACLIAAAAPASMASDAVVSPSRRDAPLADAGALDDPLVARVDPLLEVGVGEARWSGRRCPSRRSPPACSGDSQPGDRLALAQAFAVGGEHAHEDAAERAAHGRGRARAVEVADGLALVDQ